MRLLTGIPSHLTSRRPRLTSRRGVTIVELAIVIIMLGIIAAMMVPKIGRGIASRELDRVSMQLATDLRAGGQLAMRHRRPVQFRAVGTTGYEIVDKATTTTSYLKRDFGSANGGSATFSNLPTLDFYPNGLLGVVTSGVTFPVTMTATVNGSSRTVVVTRVGYVRTP